MKRYFNIIACFIHTAIFAQYKTEIHVALDGSGDFTSIQKAIDETKCFPDTPITIFIKNGTYHEKVKVHQWNNRLTLKGESTSGVVISWGDYFDGIHRGRNSTFHTATLLVEGDECRVENMTIENSAGPVGQAVAVAVAADRAKIVDCRLLGHQDTLFADGANARHHYIHCYIEGTTDFIFGGATAFFENCEIHSKSNSFITAASTPKDRAFGFVFQKCDLTAAEGVDDVYLGRPWRSFAKTVFLNCKFGHHIKKEGWDNWSSAANEKTVFYAEYNNSGPGAPISGRVKWSKSLSKKAAKKYTIKEVLKSFSLPDM